MGKYQLIFDYRTDVKYRESFNELSKLVFGLDFKKWYDAGCWNDDFICYSYLDGERVIANVSVNKMNLIINSKPVKAIQLGTVMTHPDYRNQGLSAELMKIVMSEYEKEYDLIYLFANESVLDFYPKFGFKAVQESQFTMNQSEYPIQSVMPSTARKLAPDDGKDFDLLKDFAENRKPISAMVGVRKNPHLLWFYFLLAFPDSIYYLEELESIVLFEETDRQLHVYDIVSKTEINVLSILENIVTKNTETIHFHFTPDFKNDCICVKETDREKDKLFVRPLLKHLPPHFLFPITSHS